MVWSPPQEIVKLVSTPPKNEAPWMFLTPSLTRDFSQTCAQVKSLEAKK